MGVAGGARGGGRERDSRVGGRREAGGGSDRIGVRFRLSQSSIFPGGGPIAVGSAALRPIGASRSFGASGTRRSGRPRRWLGSISRGGGRDRVAPWRRGGGRWARAWARRASPPSSRAQPHPARGTGTRGGAGWGAGERRTARTRARGRASGWVVAVAARSPFARAPASGLPTARGSGKRDAMVVRARIDFRRCRSRRARTYLGADADGDAGLGLGLRGELPAGREGRVAGGSEVSVALEPTRGVARRARDRARERPIGQSSSDRAADNIARRKPSRETRARDVPGDRDAGGELGSGGKGKGHCCWCNVWRACASGASMVRAAAPRPALVSHPNDSPASENAARDISRANEKPARGWRAARGGPSASRVTDRRSRPANETDRDANRGFAPGSRCQIPNDPFGIWQRARETPTVLSLTDARSLAVIIRQASAPSGAWFRGFVVPPRHLSHSPRAPLGRCSGAARALARALGRALGRHARTRRRARRARGVGARRALPRLRPRARVRRGRRRAPKRRRPRGGWARGGRRAGGAPPGGVVRESDPLLVSLLDGTVQALDRRTGETLWTFSSGGPLVRAHADRAAPAFPDAADDDDDDDAARGGGFGFGGPASASAGGGSASRPATVFPGVDGSLFALADDSVVTRLPVTAAQLVEASPSMTRDGALVVGGRSSLVFALDAKTGALLKTVDADGVTTHAQQHPSEEDPREDPRDPGIPGTGTGTISRSAVRPPGSGRGRSCTSGARSTPCAPSTRPPVASGGT